MYNLILVDDEPLALDTLSTILDYSEYGFCVVGCFGSGEDALSYIDKNKVDALITDVNMPGMTGLDLARICAEKHTNIETAVVTAYRDFNYAYEALKHGVQIYILKPVLITEYIDGLKKLFNRLDSRKNEKFISVTQRATFQELFLKIASGIKVENLSSALDELSISPETAPCTFLNLRVENYDDYFREHPKYDREKLNNILENFIPFKFFEMYSIALKSTKDDTLAILIHREREGLEKRVDNYIETLRNEFLSTLKLQVKITVLNQFDKISEISDILSEGEDASKYRPNTNTLKKALAYINSRYKEDISVKDMAAHVNLSQAYFGSYFKKNMGEAPIDYLNKIRIEKAKELLKENAYKISAIGEEVGYKSAAYFYATFKQLSNGMTPSQYRELFHK